MQTKSIAAITIFWLSLGIIGALIKNTDTDSFALLGAIMALMVGGSLAYLAKNTLVDDVLECRDVGSVAIAGAATLLFFLFFMAATYQNIFAPTSAWDFFGEEKYGVAYEGYAHAALRHVGVNIQSDQMLSTGVTDRHPQIFIAVTGLTGIISKDHLGGYGAFSLWLGCALIMFFVLAFMKNHLGSIRPIADFKILALILFALPLFENHVGISGYYELPMCAALVSVLATLVFSVIHRNLYCFVAAILISLVAVSVRGPAWIFVVIIFVAFSSAIVMVEVMPIFERMRHRKYRRTQLMLAFFMLVMLLFCLFLFFRSDWTELTVVGKRLVWVQPDWQRVLSTELRILIMNSSFSVIAVAWIASIVAEAGNFKFETSRMKKIVVFNFLTVALSIFALSVFQATTYGSGISLPGSDTGMTRLHMAPVAFMLVSLTCSVRLVLSRPKRVASIFTP